MQAQVNKTVLVDVFLISTSAFNQPVSMICYKSLLLILPTIIMTKGYLPLVVLASFSLISNNTDLIINKFSLPMRKSNLSLSSNASSSGS